MKHRGLCLLLISVLLLGGCGTTYVYHGYLEAENSVGDMRNHLVYWTKTERPLWFDECSGSVRLLTECSNETVAFDETEGGIIFRQTQYHKGVTHPVGKDEPCGEIVGAEKISELSEGKLRLKVYCTYDSTDFTIGNHWYLKAREEAYEFDIVRKKKSDFEGEAPERPECRE